MDRWDRWSSRDAALAEFTRAPGAVPRTRPIPTPARPCPGPRRTG